MVIFKEDFMNEVKNNIEELTSKLMEAEDIIKQFEKICVYFEDEYLSIYKIAYLKLKFSISLTNGYLD